MEQNLVIIFIDVKKAFDSVSHALIKKALRDAAAPVRAAQLASLEGCSCLTSTHCTMSTVCAERAAPCQRLRVTLPGLPSELGSLRQGVAAFPREAAGWCGDVR